MNEITVAGSRTTSLTNRRRLFFASLATLLLAGWPILAAGYPLDGYESTGIGRLEAQRLIQVGEMPGKKRPSGELLPLAMVDLRLLDHRDMELPQSDPKLTARLKKLLGLVRVELGSEPQMS